MSELAWLRKVVEGRTKGPWGIIRDHTFHGYSWGDKGGNIGYVYETRNPLGNSKFIATMGSLADKMLDVIEAAGIENNCSACQGRPGLIHNSMCKALAALQAACGEIEK